MTPPVPKGNLFNQVIVDPSGILYTVSCDVDGNVKVTALTDALKAADLNLDATKSLIVDGKSPSIFRPTTQGAFLYNPNLPAGTSDQIIFTAPANQGYKLKSITIWYSGTIAGVYLQIVIVAGGQAILYNQVAPVISGNFYNFVLDVDIVNGDVLKCSVNGATLNDDFIGEALLSRVY